MLEVTKQARVAGLVLWLAAVAAASYTSHFYSSEEAALADTSCHEEVFTTSSENSCAIQCRKVACFRFRVKSGNCYITGRAGASSQNKDFVFEKVSVTSSS